MSSTSGRRVDKSVFKYACMCRDLGLDSWDSVYKCATVSLCVLIWVSAAREPCVSVAHGEGKQEDKQRDARKELRKHLDT